MLKVKIFPKSNQNALLMNGEYKEQMWALESVYSQLSMCSLSFQTEDNTWGILPKHGRNSNPRLFLQTLEWIQKGNWVTFFSPGFPENC